MTNLLCDKFSWTCLVLCLKTYWCGYFIGWSNLELNHFDQYINGLNDVKEFIKRGNLDIAADLSVFVNNSAQLFVWIWQGDNNTYEHDSYNDGMRSIEWNYYVLINLKH